MNIHVNKSVASIIAKANECYWKNEFEKALLLADKTLALAIKQKDYTAQADSLLIQMQSHMSLGNSAEARKFSERLLHLTSKKCAVHIHANALIESGYLYLQYLEYKKAEDLTAEAVILARDNNLIDLEADALVQLATLDRHRRNFKEALIYIRQAQKITQSSKRQEAIIETMLEKGLIFGASGDYEKALDTFEEAEAQSAKLKLYDYQIESILYRGDVYRATGDIDKAERLYDKALDVSDKHGISTKTAEILKRVGYLLLHRRDYEKALQWYVFAEEQITRFKAKPFFPFVFLGYGTVYNGLENHKKAMDYLWKALDLLAPDYLLHADILTQILEQLDLAYRNMRQESKSRNLLDLIRRIGEVLLAGVDGSHAKAQSATVLERDMAELMESLRLDEVRYFTRKGLRVDLTSGAIFRNGKRSKRGLTDNQLLIFKLLLTNIGFPVNNTDIIASYQERAKGMEELPRRAHYYVDQIRKKLGNRNIIMPVKGEGYMIPSE